MSRMFLDVVEGDHICIMLPCCRTEWYVHCFSDGRMVGRICSCGKSYQFKDGVLIHPDGLHRMVAQIHPPIRLDDSPSFPPWPMRFDPVEEEVKRKSPPLTTGGMPVDLTTLPKVAKLVDKIKVDIYTIQVSHDTGLLVCDCPDWSIEYPLCPHVANLQVTGGDVPLMQYENPVKKMVTFPVLSQYEPRQTAMVFLIPLKSKVAYAAVLHLACAHGDPADVDDISGAVCNLCNMDPNVASNKVFDRNMLPSNAVPLGTVSAGDGRLALVRMVVAESNRRSYMCSARSHHEIIEAKVQEKLAFKQPRLWEHYQWTVLNLGCCPTCFTLKREAVLAGSGIGRLDEK